MVVRPLAGVMAGRPRIKDPGSGWGRLQWAGLSPPLSGSHSPPFWNPAQGDKMILPPPPVLGLPFQILLLISQKKQSQSQLYCRGLLTARGRAPWEAGNPRLGRGLAIVRVGSRLAGVRLEGDAFGELEVRWFASELHPGEGGEKKARGLHRGSQNFPHCPALAREAEGRGGGGAKGRARDRKRALH